MELIYRLDMKVTAPTKTTTRIVLGAFDVKVERTAGSVQRALEEALSEFATKLRPVLLKEAREARKGEAPAVIVAAPEAPADPEAPEEPAGPLPEHGPLFREGGSGPLKLSLIEHEAELAATAPRITGLTVPGADSEA